MKTLTDKVVVITGAGSGIGRALALNAARRGAQLALSDADGVGIGRDRTPDRLARVRTDLLDVRDRVAVAGYAQSVADEFGAVNVIIRQRWRGPDRQRHRHDVRRLRVDRRYRCLGCGARDQEFLPYLIAGGDGHIVNISSLFGLLSIPGQSAYTAAKFAVRGFTEALRQEMLIAGHPMQGSCVHPGGIKTSIARNARATEGEDQAALAEFFDRKLAKTTADKAA